MSVTFVHLGIGQVIHGPAILDFGPTPVAATAVHPPVHIVSGGRGAQYALPSRPSRRHLHCSFESQQSPQSASAMLVISLVTNKILSDGHQLALDAECDISAPVSLSSKQNRFATGIIHQMLCANVRSLPGVQIGWAKANGAIIVRANSGPGPEAAPEYDGDMTEFIPDETDDTEVMVHG